MEAFETITRNDIKRINRLRIYNLLRTEGEHTSLDISQKLSLSLPTVNKNVSALEKDKLVVSYEGKNDTGGRNPRIYNADPYYRVGVSVSITLRHIVAVVVDLRGNVRSRLRIREDFVRDDLYFRKLGNAVSEVMGQADIPESSVLGVNLVVPALITKDGQDTYYNGVLHMKPHVTCEEFAKYIPYPTKFAHDASSAAFAESWFNHNVTDFVYFMVSDTICSAPILEQLPYPGLNNRSGEIGHVTMVPGGRPCYCGKRGCTDSYLSTRILSDAVGGDLPLFFEKLAAGDAQLQELWEDYLSKLVISISSLRLLFDCKVVIGGYLGQYADPYMDHIRELVLKEDPFSVDEDYVSVCACKRDASAIGGALYLIDEFIRSI